MRIALLDPLKGRSLRNLGLLLAIALVALLMPSGLLQAQSLRSIEAPDISATPPPGGFVPWSLEDVRARALVRSPQVLDMWAQELAAKVQVREVEGQLQPQVGFQFQVVRQTPLIDEIDIDTSGLANFALTGIPTGQVPGQPAPPPTTSDEPGPPPTGTSLPTASPNLGFDDLGVFPENIITVGFKLQQTLYASGKIRESIQLMSLNAALKGKELEQARQEVSFLSSQIYLSILLGEESVATLEEMATELDQILKDTEGLQAQGFITQAEVLEAKGGVFQVRSQIESLKADLVNAREGLRIMLGANLEDPLELVGTLEDVKAPTFESLERLEALATENRRDLQSQELQYDLALAQVELERSDLAFRPQAGLSIEGGLRGLEYPIIQTNWLHEWGTYIQIGVGLKFNVYDGGIQRAQVGQAEINKFRADIGYREFQRIVVTDVRKAHSALLAKESALAFAEVSLEAKAEKNRIGQERLGAGDLGRAESLGQTIELYQARTNLSLARYNLRMAELELQRAAGLLPASPPQGAITGGAQ